MGEAPAARTRGDAAAERKRDRDRPSGGILAIVRRAFEEFLTLPTAIVVAFLALAVAMYALDRARLAALAPARETLQSLVFGSSKATSDLLGTVASGLITVTSITVSLLLVALQQAATALTSGVVDQFLRRRVNQFYFGFFVGLSLYALVTLATITDDFNPVFGATLAFLLTAAALCLLILLLYTSVDQMRPAEIVEEIHRLTLLAGEAHRDLTRRTRRAPASMAPMTGTITARDPGYVTRIAVDALAALARDGGDDAEIELLPSIGAFVAFHDPVAHLRGMACDDAAVERVRRAIALEVQRDITQDPAAGIEELEMIGWTSISSAKSNPGAGLLAIRILRDVMAHWCAMTAEADRDAVTRVVYHDDVYAQLFGAFEDFAIASSESMQHQAFLEVIRTFATMYDRLPAAERWRVDDVVLRILSALGDLVLTRDLERALADLAVTLRDAGRSVTAGAVDGARAALSRSMGRLNSRSTRVPAPSP
jgi:uncharacterized membrane protein